MREDELYRRQQSTRLATAPNRTFTRSMPALNSEPTPRFNDPLSREERERKYFCEHCKLRGIYNHTLFNFQAQTKFSTSPAPREALFGTSRMVPVQNDQMIISEISKYETEQYCTSKTSDITIMHPFF